MEKIAFNYEVIVHFRLTGRELEIIFKTAEHHYDDKCKSAVIPGPNAFVNGWKNRLFMSGGFNARNRKENVEVSASWRDLDTVAKILEMSAYGLFENAEVAPLRTAVRALMTAIAEERQNCLENAEARAAK